MSYIFPYGNLFSLTFISNYTPCIFIDIFYNIKKTKQEFYGKISKLRFTRKNLDYDYRRERGKPCSRCREIHSIMKLSFSFLILSSVNLVYVSMYHIHTRCQPKQEEDVGSSGTEITDSCEPSSGF